MSLLTYVHRGGSYLGLFTCLPQQKYYGCVHRATGGGYI